MKEHEREFIKTKDSKIREVQNKIRQTKEELLKVRENLIGLSSELKVHMEDVNSFIKKNNISLKEIDEILKPKEKSTVIEQVDSVDAPTESQPDVPASP